MLLKPRYPFRTKAFRNDDSVVPLQLRRAPTRGPMAGEKGGSSHGAMGEEMERPAVFTWSGGGGEDHGDEGSY
jgi:hypothetical protein